ncbi:MAG: hypothetical protein KGH61_02980 [Candidatus Micrarchaeota archaeon]|nr:hypothetical protein [Candidatus Micrarchaeota archaeon]MDE1847887.1 hypothetical protein [Candidatus Micrarchaeota archaeon]MDE1864513.1 hypothetical protein [Candidatus Micrarchaeota archaeon]
MNPYQETKKLISQLLDVKKTIDMLYEFLPRNDYYRLRQLLEGAEQIMKKYQ